MKKKILLLMGVFAFGLLQAQVGINTTNPQGIFHFDGKGNTTGSANLKDDIIIAGDGNSGVMMSIGGPIIEGASMSLHSTTKGFVPNRVALTSALDLGSVPSTVEGMVIYNTIAAGTYPNNTLPGYYMYTGSRWRRLRTSAFLGASETRILKQAVTTTSSNTTVGATAPELDFGEVEIFEDGAYAFSFNVEATSSTQALANGLTRGVIYIHILKKSMGSSSYTGSTVVEFDPALFPYGQSFTLTTIAGVELKAGDKLKFTTRHYQNLPSITYSADYTYMMYWML